MGNGASETAVRVFLNYRHDDTQGTAWGMYYPLRERFGRENVFFDNGKLRAGDKFLAEIESHIESADVFLALIGSEWMGALVKRGHKEDTDFVEHEIAKALGRAPPLPVIAVLVDGTNPPDAAKLPLALKGLAEGHVAHVRHTNLDEDVASLIKVLDEIVSTGNGKAPKPDRMERPKVKPPSVDVEVPAHDLPEVDPEARVAPGPDEDHYEEVVREARDTGIAVFLGSCVNLEDFTTLPDDKQLAEYLAASEKLSESTFDLASIAQHIRAMRGDHPLFNLIRQGLGGEAAPGTVHRYLARLPTRLEDLGLERRYQMIVTPKYDAELERAFKEAKEEYDSVVYVRRTTDSPPRWVHVPWDGAPVTIQTPSDYTDLPIRYDLELERTLIVRIHGSVVDPDLNYTVKDNYVITEDHYIEYLSGSPISQLVPTQIIEKLRSSSYLFLGYTMSDWRLRVFLKRLWEGETLGTSSHWAVERSPTRLERKLWKMAGVELYQSSLTEYVSGLDAYLEAHKAELVQ